MKRIAALAALMITMLAVPTAAMASTGSSGPGHGSPVPVRVTCPVTFRERPGTLRVVHLNGHAKRHRHGRPVQVRLVCPFPPPRPFPAGCRPQLLTFSVPSGSSTFTEVSGPVLAPPEEFTYDGSTYTIMSVDPGADSFTVFLDGHLFVNEGAAITAATAVMACSG
jgi:hypothetical protein